MQKSLTDSKPTNKFIHEKHPSIKTRGMHFPISPPYSFPNCKLHVGDSGHEDSLKASEQPSVIVLFGPTLAAMCKQCAIPVAQKQASNALFLIVGNWR